MPLLSQAEWGRQFGSSSRFSRATPSASIRAGNAFVKAYSPRDAAAYQAYASDYRKQEQQTRLDKLLKEFQAAQDKANLENLKRYKQGLGIFDELATTARPGAPVSPTVQRSRDLLQENIGTFAPGGSFGEGAKAEFEEGARQSRGRAFQNLVSSGMANITGAFDVQATKERGRFGLNLEDIRAGRETGARTALSTSLSGFDESRRLALERARTGKTGFIERREDIGPDPNLLAQLIAQASAA